MCSVHHLAWLWLLAAASAWPSAALPEAEAVGAYAAGCVRGAQALPLDGPGYQVMRPGRGHYYGHPALIAFVQKLALAFQARSAGTLLVGDLALPRGGPVPGLHNSHQTGLDVDIWFRLGADGQALGNEERENLPMLSLVGAGGAEVDETRAALLRLAAEQPEVDRIFVNPHIKQALCAQFTGDRAWLRKLRPWWGHDAHFHVRLRCPAGDRACLEQEALPPGDGCDSGLAWWFSAEARTRPASSRPKQPALPAACAGLLQSGE